MPSAPLQQPPVQVLMAATLKNLCGQAPGGLASPCAPGGSSVTQASGVPALSTHMGAVVPWTVMVVCPPVQSERSPCLAASMATTVMPCAANPSATWSMLARPPPNPCRNTTMGEHLPKGARGPAHVSRFVLLAFGVAMSTLMVSGTAPAGLGLKAPVAGSSRLNVVMVVSRISSMLFGAGILEPSMPNLLNTAAGVEGVTGPGSAVGAGVE